MRQKLDLTKVTKEASVYLIKRWELELEQNRFLTPEQQSDLKFHIDSHQDNIVFLMENNLTIAADFKSIP